MAATSLETLGPSPLGPGQAYLDTSRREWHGYLEQSPLGTAQSPHLWHGQLGEKWLWSPLFCSDLYRMEASQACAIMERVM